MQIRNLIIYLSREYNYLKSGNCCWVLIQIDTLHKIPGDQLSWESNYYYNRVTKIQEGNKFTCASQSDPNRCVRASYRNRHWLLADVTRRIFRGVGGSSRITNKRFNRIVVKSNKAVYDKVLFAAKEPIKASKDRSILRYGCVNLSRCHYFHAIIRVRRKKIAQVLKTVDLERNYK